MSLGIDEEEKKRIKIQKRKKEKDYEKDGGEDKRSEGNVI